MLNVGISLAPPGQQWPGGRRGGFSLLLPRAADVVLQLLPRQILCSHHQPGQPGSAEALPNQHQEVRIPRRRPAFLFLFIINNYGFLLNIPALNGQTL